MAAAIWGFAFVAQRVGMNYMGPFTFNGIRFALGAVSLIPIILVGNSKSSNKQKGNNKIYFISGIILGVILFGGSTFQQIGLINTSAGKAGFITDLYIIFVPIIGIALKKRTHMNVWFGALLAVLGLYFLCVTNKFSISYGDLFELIGAFFYSLHILFVDYFSSKVDSVKLAFSQYIACSVLSLIVGICFESISLGAIINAAVPIVYGGVFSVGIAYTFQIIGQKGVEPTRASIIMSLESAFAAIGGFFILNEHLSLKSILGCALMFSGMLISQINIVKNKNHFEEIKEKEA